MAKLPFKLPVFWNENKKTPRRKAAPNLKMFFFIVDWDKAESISRVFEEEHVRFHFISKGRGTASSEIHDLLGIGASDKAVIVCVEQEVLVPVLLKEVRKKLGFHKPGAGIAFTIPLSGINTPLLRVFKESINKNEKISITNEGETMASGKKAAAVINNDLIIAVINHGYSEDFMNAAREAGASGGTVVHARGLAHEGPVKFFGIAVQEEKEIVLVLTSREKKLPIMEAVSRSCGITTKAEGLIFSLPVENVMGLNLE
ncbi:MAG: P-II family nitrogen regulator [Treponema sp.]|jgi:nitrogen regulatory protein PII|nr:P-II family nitrogen regulator [Treponema sp.]